MNELNEWMKRESKHFFSIFIFPNTPTHFSNCKKKKYQAKKQKKKITATSPSLPNFRFFFPLDCFGAEFDADGLLSLFFHRMPNMSVYKKYSTYKTRRNEKFRPSIRKRAHRHSLMHKKPLRLTQKLKKPRKTKNQSKNVEKKERKKKENSRSSSTEKFYQIKKTSNTFLFFLNNS